MISELLELVRLFPRLLDLARALKRGDLSAAFEAYSACELASAERARAGTAAGAAAYAAGKRAGR